MVGSSRSMGKGLIKKNRLTALTEGKMGDIQMAWFLKFLTLMGKLSQELGWALEMFVLNKTGCKRNLTQGGDGG